MYLGFRNIPKIGRRLWRWLYSGMLTEMEARALLTASAESATRGSPLWFIRAAEVSFVKQAFEEAMFICTC